MRGILIVLAALFLGDIFEEIFMIGHPYLAAALLMWGAAVLVRIAILESERAA